jgi:protein-L-isoaspartate O-methyltransferase
MVIPIGSQEGTQNLVVLVKNKTGEITKKEVLPVSFVPLV